jgi:hypothetical protein
MAWDEKPMDYLGIGIVRDGALIMIFRFSSPAGSYFFHCPLPPTPCIWSTGEERKAYLPIFGEPWSVPPRQLFLKIRKSKIRIASTAKNNLLSLWCIPIIILHAQKAIGAIVLLLSLSHVYPEDNFKMKTAERGFSLLNQWTRRR